MATMRVEGLLAGTSQTGGLLAGADEVADAAELGLALGRLLLGERAVAGRRQQGLDLNYSVTVGGQDLPGERGHGLIQGVR